MSTHLDPSTSDPERQAAGTSFTVANAPRTFDPYNTNPTPETFSKKWHTSRR